MADYGAGGKIETGETGRCFDRELKKKSHHTVSSCLAPLAFASHDYDDMHLILLLMPVADGREKPTSGRW